MMQFVKNIYLITICKKKSVLKKETQNDFFNLKPGLEDINV